MLLRSSSTPVLGSLLSSFSDSPHKDFDSNNKHPSSTPDHHLKKISFSHGGQPNLSFFSCNSSPISPSVVGFSDLDKEPNRISSRGFRRARSTGNLEGLTAAPCDIDELDKSNPPPRSSRRPNISMLQTIPSFSIYNSRGGFEEEEEDEVDEEEKQSEFNERKESLERSITIGDSIMALGSGALGSGELGSGEFSFESFDSFEKSMGMIEEESLSELRNLGVEEEGEPMSSPLFLARGLGIDVGGGGGGDFASAEFGEGGRDGSNVEEYYKSMVEGNPCNPLFLRNYAQFLYQTKGDLRGAEEYYSRAILADPRDGEILSRYAKLVWELHHDHERASSYFERAVQAAPEDSHVLAAYASFLWETEDGEEEESLSQDLVGVPMFHNGAMASASA